MPSKIKIKKIKVHPINKPSLSASDAMLSLMKHECIIGINRYFYLHQPTSIKKLLYIIYVIILTVLAISLKTWEVLNSTKLYGPSHNHLIYLSIGGLCFQLLKIILYTFFSKTQTIAYFERLQEFDVACDSRTISKINIIAKKEIILIEIVFSIFLPAFVLRPTVFSIIRIFSFSVDTLECCYQIATIMAILARVLVLEHQLKHKTGTPTENEATVKTATFFRMFITKKYIKSLVRKENKTEIQKLCEKYLILFKSSAIWNETFGLVIVIRQVLYAFDMSFFIANIYNSNFKDAFSISSAIFLQHTIYVVAPYIIGERINMSLKRMKAYILKRLVTESIQRRELKAFLARLESKHLSFTAWGLFKLDVSTLRMSLSYIFVLILMILQFSTKKNSTNV